MYCAVYKSLKKPDHFVYVATQSTENLPDALQKMLAPFGLVLSFTLTPERKLAQENSQTVLQSLLGKGFFLQLPKDPRLNLVNFKTSI